MRIKIKSLLYHHFIHTLHTKHYIQGVCGLNHQTLNMNPKIGS